LSVKGESALAANACVQMPKKIVYQGHVRQTTKIPPILISRAKKMHGWQIRGLTEL